MRQFVTMPVVLFACAALGVGLLTGCEDSDLTGNEFQISPSSVDMSTDDTSVTLEAVGGEEPMSWEVSDESLGTLSGSGRTVVYARTAQSGINAVTVTDAQTWTATCQITQTDEADEENVSISPTSATLSHDDDKRAFTADGGSSPYSWSVGISDRGSVEAQDDTSTAVYTRTDSGENTVLVTDSEGTVAVATVSQPQDTTLSISANPSTLNNDEDVSVLSVSGGTSPYTWSVGDDALGGLSSQSGNSVVYTRNSAGNNVVTVEDAEGYTASVIMSQP